MFLYGTGGGGRRSELPGSSISVSLDEDEGNVWVVELESDEELPLDDVVALGKDARGALEILLGRAGREGGDITVVEAERIFLLRMTGGLGECPDPKCSGDADVASLQHYQSEARINGNNIPEFRS